MTNLPVLYKLTSAGKIQTWRIWVLPGTDENPAAMIFTQYGLKDGKQQTTSEVIAQGKNLGKANETTPLQQAELEALSQWEKKLKRAYVQNMDDAAEGKVDTNAITGGVTPMLAKSYSADANKITFPAFVQPKLDGHRCIAIIQDGEATLWSRTRKRITGVPHIERELEAHFVNRMGTLVLDGELYNHDYKDSFEDLSSFIRQTTPKPGHEVVQYWVYDVIEAGSAFSHRALLLADLGLGGTKSVKEVPTAIVDDEEAMIRVFGIYVEAGFEGLMIRNSAGLYKNSRSADLQKVKTFDDAEFEIVDVVEGRGAMAGKGVFVLKTETGEEFSAKMVGALDSLSEYLVNKDKYIGKQMTVKFQGMTNGNVPRFPVAMRFREDV